MVDSSVRHFKKIAREDIPQALQWFEQQQLATQWHLGRDEQLTLLGSVDASTYQRWLADIANSQIPVLPENVITRGESVYLGVNSQLRPVTH